MKSRRVQLSRANGWRMPAQTLKVDRTTKWGNPFVVGQHSSREECVRLFSDLVVGKKVQMGRGDPAQQQRYIRQVENEIEELRGYNLACWCAPADPCHADVLLEILTRSAKPKKGRA